MSFRRVNAGRVLRAGAGAAMAVMAACSSDRQSTLAPSVPQPPAGQPSVLGMVEGQVDSTGKVTFTTSSGPSTRLGSGVSGNVYGTQGVNVLLYASRATVTTSGGRTVWSFNVGVQNLESFPIGANQAGLAPSDTLGVFVAITSPPFATSGKCTNPTTCVTFTSAMGTGFFTAPGQQFVYWHDRLGATFGTDTTRTRKPFTFSAQQSSATGFRFTMTVGAAWPPPQQSAWNVFYNGASNALPEDTTKGGPPWDRSNMPTVGGLASEVAGPNFLETSGGGNKKLTGQNIYFSRDDSLDASANAAMQVDLVYPNSKLKQTNPETVFGLADNAGRLAMVGISQNRIGFVTFGSILQPLTWAFIPGSPTAAATPTTRATYLVQKFGTDHVALLVNGVPTLTLSYTSLPTKTALLPLTSSAIFGASSVTGPSDVDWFSVKYTIGSTTLGNGAP